METDDDNLAMNIRIRHKSAFMMLSFQDKIITRKPVGFMQSCCLFSVWSPLLSLQCVVSPIVSPVGGVPCCPPLCGGRCCPYSVWCPLLFPQCVVSPVVSPVCGVPCCLPCVWCPLLSLLYVVSPVVPSVCGIPCCLSSVWCPLLSPLECGVPCCPYSV